VSLPHVTLLTLWRNLGMRLGFWQIQSLLAKRRK
jgi:hypothetical protein